MSRKLQKIIYYRFTINNTDTHRTTCFIEVYSDGISLCFIIFCIQTVSIIAYLYVQTNQQWESVASQ